MSVSNKLLMAANTEKPFFSLIAYTGDSTDPREFNVGHPTSMVINKTRDRTTGNGFCLNDVVRGVGLHLRPDNANAETISANTIREFTSNGFKTGGSSFVNNSPYTYVAYSFSTGGATTVSNTEGSLTSSVNASVDNGFSICTYTGNGTIGATYGHGLNTAPELVITKIRDDSDNWRVTGTIIGDNLYIALDLPNSLVTIANTPVPTSSLITLANDNEVNTNTSTYVSYCFHSVEGKSKIGTYTGNGNATGPSVSLGFEPAFLLIKRTSSTADWMLYDSSRDASNPRTTAFRLNLNNVEETYGGVDFNASSFQIKSTVYELNTNSHTYLYLAIAGD